MNLEQFTGTTKFYRHPLGCLYTDGIAYMAEQAEAYWLIEAIFSYVPQIEKLGEWFFPIRFEKFDKHGKDCWCLAIGDAENSHIFHQEIEYSTFPLDHIMLFFAKNSFGWTLMLPNEY